MATTQEKSSTKVSLISPRDTFLKDAGDRPPLGIAYIGAYLRERGIDVSLVDMNHTDTLPKADIYGVSVATPNYSEAMDIGTRLMFEGLLVAGGPHPSAVPESMDGFGKVVIGEGERAMYEICQNPTSPKREIRSELIQDLDSLPHPARDLLPMDKYSLKIDDEPATPIITSRGCPYGCIYCGKQMYGRKWRAHSAGYVVNEMRDIKEEFDIKAFYIYDDTFTLDKKRAHDICFLLHWLPKTKFRCTSRVDCVDKSLLAALKKAGCDEICYGVESGNNDILRNINKGFTKETVIRTVKETKEAGIRTKLYFMLGLPGDTEKTMRETIEFSKELDPDEAGFYILTPYPGSELWDDPLKYGIEIEHDPNWKYIQAGKEPSISINHQNINKEVILQYYVEANKLWENK